MPDQIATPSLDRFIQNRAILGLGYPIRRPFFPNLIIGASMTAIGLGLLVVPALGGNPEVTAGAIGPLIAGLVNLGVAGVVYLRTQGQVPVTWKLTPEAKAFLWQLYRRTDMGKNLDTGDAFTNHVRRQRVLRRARWMGWETGTNIDPKVLAILERAAAAFNRIHGTVESGEKTNATLTKMAPNILKASDDAMAEILHHAATAAKFPESADSVMKQIDARIDSLNELGDRISEIAEREPTMTEKVAYSSPIDGVLEDLRLENLARSELTLPKEDEAEQQQDQRA